MSTEFIMGIARQAIETTLMVSFPVLLISLVVGVVISLFQAVTQIQEMTITFVPKIVATFLAMLFLGAWMMDQLVGLTVEIFTNFPHWIE